MVKDRASGEIIMFKDPSRLEKAYLDYLDNKSKGYGAHLYALNEKEFYKGMREFFKNEFKGEL